MLARFPARSHSFRVSLALTICGTLLLLPNTNLLFKGLAAQGQSGNSGQRDGSTPGKPEGTWPTMEQINAESRIQREAPLPISSTIRSKKNSGKPWDGRRVGDPWLDKVDQGTNRSSSRSILIRNERTRRAHTHLRMSAPPLVLDNQFVLNFFTYALARSPGANEDTYWYDQLRVAYGQGQESL
ncbi:MAG TPA: hypothetical protein VFH46_05910, partial [Pyrinomonadaceae bacterium]|nr:hypothetical protein [Pyrinomonadaceae bacterium]